MADLIEINLITKKIELAIYKAAYFKKYYEKNSERLKSNGREYDRVRDKSEKRIAEKKVNMEKFVEKRCRKSYLISSRNASRKWKYGISHDIYNDIKTKQDGVCAICGSPPGKKDLALDHCHNTGEVRGLLCTNCNQGIGHLRDDVNRLRQAIVYLETTHTGLFVKERTSKKGEESCRT